MTIPFETGKVNAALHRRGSVGVTYPTLSGEGLEVFLVDRDRAFSTDGTSTSRRTLVAPVGLRSGVVTFGMGLSFTPEGCAEFFGSDANLGVSLARMLTELDHTFQTPRGT